MAGNLKEWTANAAGDERYILGGAWDEPAYEFSIPDARRPFAREGTFGFRCVQRPTAPPEASFAPLTLRPRGRRERALQSPMRPTLFFNLHIYPKSELDARVERVDPSPPYWRRKRRPSGRPTAMNGSSRICFCPRTRRLLTRWWRSWAVRDRGMEASGGLRFPLTSSSSGPGEP